MTTKYIGHNCYRYRYFKSPLGFTKFLLDGFISTKFINITESNLPKEITEEQIEAFAKSEIKRIENLK